MFHREAFLQTVEDCYNDPLSITQKDLCRLNLVLAIGLVIACPLQGTEAGVVIQKLHREPINRAELFYRNARDLYGPATGFQDADFWSVQALLLMSLYLLAVSGRNASYIYVGKQHCHFSCLFSLVFNAFPLSLNFNSQLVSDYDG